MHKLIFHDVNIDLEEFDCTILGFEIFWINAVTFRFRNWEIFVCLSIYLLSNFFSWTVILQAWKIICLWQNSM